MSTTSKPIMDRVWEWVDALTRPASPQSAAEDLPTIQAHYEAQIEQARVQGHGEGVAEALVSQDEAFAAGRAHGSAEVSAKAHADIQALIAAHKEELETEKANARSEGHLQGFEEAVNEQAEVRRKAYSDGIARGRQDAENETAAQVAKAREEGYNEGYARKVENAIADIGAQTLGYWTGVKAAYDLVRTMPQSTSTRASEEAFEASRRRFARVLKQAVHDKAWKAED